MSDDNKATMDSTFEEPRFKVSWQTGWDLLKGNCTICHRHLSELCGDCQGGKNPPKEDCVIAEAKCCHAFHFHCISIFLKNNQVCPVDKNEWEFEKYYKYEDKKE